MKKRFAKIFNTKKQKPKPSRRRGCCGGRKK